jgi:hypothetical protein
MALPNQARAQTVWAAVWAAEPSDRRRHYTVADRIDSLRHHARVWWGGIAFTAAAALAAWFLQAPEAIATIRLELEAPAEGARPVVETGVKLRVVAAAAGVIDDAAVQLSALRMAGWSLVFPGLSPDRAGDATEALQRLRMQESVRLADGGLAVTVSVWHRDAAAARAMDNALARAILARQPHEQVDVPPPAPDPRPALRMERTRLAGELDAADRRGAVLSQSLIDMARDMVEALRSTDNRSSGTEVADQGAALLADLQLKRLQMASKYQDGYPALAALDAEIAKLRGMMAGEQKRSTSVRSAANPVFEALAAERRRAGAELEALNTHRADLRAQIDLLDHRLAAPPPVAAPPIENELPRLVSDRPVLSWGPDPRQLSLPLIALVGLVGTMLLQWLMMRERRCLVTPAEVELVLGLPVLRCLDPDGASLRALEAPKLSLAEPS